MATPLAVGQEPSKLSWPAHTFGVKSTTHFLTITEAFLHHAHKQPQAMAATDLSQPDYPVHVTYRELLQHSTRLASRLRQLGVLPGTRVPLVVKRGVDMLVGIMAILLCGAQYVPLDGGVVPDSTLQLVIEQSGGNQCTVLVTKQTRHRFNSCRVANVVCIDILEAEEHSSGESDPSVQNLATPDHGCYVIYTSGKVTS